MAYIDEPLTVSRRHAGSLSVTREAHLLEGGFYAPSFEYSSGCSRVNHRFLDAYEAGFPDARQLRRIARRWARRDLASVVRANTGDEPSVGTTLGYVGRAVRINPTVLATRKLLLVLAWTSIGRRGRRLLGRLLTQAQL